MRVDLRSMSCLLVLVTLGLLAAPYTFGQASYTAQIRGVVTDRSGAMVVNATISIINDATGVTQTTRSDEHGQYFFVGLRPATYTLKAEDKGFRIVEKKNVVLQVDQQSTVDFILHPLAVNETLEVTETAPLLDTESATLGTDITNEYVKEIPLINRNFFGLTFLSAGVTETAGSGTQDNYPSGTNFVSNGQRNATAEVRLDGALISAPEQGEGATSNVYYEPSVESVQEFKVQNNSFSAEFGNNGGTVVNMVMKSGSNSFHGSGWYFLQRANTDARDFFNPAPGLKPDHKRDQGGFSIGGPIRKNKTFFFGDFEKVRDDEAINIVASVPTLPERNGDFSATSNALFDPLQVNCSSGTCVRPPVQFNGQANVIPPNEINPIGKAVLNLYPQPNVPGAGEFNNFRLNTLSHGPDYQFDIKLDNQFSDKHRLSGRYSRASSNFFTPEILGSGSFNTGIAGSPTTAQNIGLEYTWTINPRIIWTSHFAVDRVKQNETTNVLSIPSFNASLPTGTPGLPSVLEANGVDQMPTFLMCCNLPWTNLFDQCCVNTKFAHTLYSYSSQLVVSKGSHLMKFGGEQRQFYNNFWQPPNPTGQFSFTDFVTSQFPNSNTDGNGNPTGNPFASLLLGYGDNVNQSSQINVFPAVANWSAETGFYFQDDWKVTPKLTLNLGIRYEWSTPYNERFNRIQFSDFTGDTGVRISLNGAGSAQQALAPLGISIPSSEELLGTTVFATSSRRSVPVYRKDVGPRLGFAYQISPATVLRGGAGIYFGMSVATNYQYPGTAFRESPNFFFTTNNFQTQLATLENPFAGFGLAPPQGTQYGKLAEWGYGNGNDLGTTAARDADIYQWNLGIQRLLPSQIVIGIDYSANRSNHLPWGGYSSTRNRDYINSNLLAQISAKVHTTDPTCDADGCVSNFLQTSVNNPFYAFFSGPGAIFNQPNSLYSAPNTTGQIPLQFLLRPFPQFTGDFEGLPLLEASSWYNALQVRFEKRMTHHVSFEGNYTISKLTDDSSVGANAFVGTLNQGNPQQLDRLNLEHGISANDTPQRLAAAVVVELPVGRNRWLGGNMNRVADAVVGGWSVSTLISMQSGQPLAILMASGRLMDGTQRPQIVCPQLSSGINTRAAALSWANATPLSVFNANCFADPGDQIPGNAPRYFSGLRSDGIHNLDVNIYKSFVPKEGMRAEVRAEFFNFFNHPRFAAPIGAQPSTGFAPGDSTFGTITSTAPGYVPRRIQFGVRFEF